MSKRDKKTLERLFKKLSCWRGKIELLFVDGFKGFPDVIRDYFGVGNSVPLVGVLNKSKSSKDGKGFEIYALYGRKKREVIKKIRKFKTGKTMNTAMIERVNRDFRDRATCMKRKSHRQARILDWVKLSFKRVRFVHNFIEPHYTLSYTTSTNWIKNPITPIMNIIQQKILDLKTILKTPLSQLIKT